ncbi:MAG TPA: DedA family protein [Candidatus Saccharimonadaceae bacterium]|nr:DedA family protein [Candidatus Saccharimonadaceae bacterium]
MAALNDLILNFGLIGIAIVIFIESGFPFGFFLPGDTLLFTAGLLAAKGHYSVALAIFIIFLANFAGVTIGYWTGKSLGKHWLKKEDNFIFRHEYVEKAEEFYKRHGGKAIILGRFIPAVRSFVPMVAGVANMSYRKLMFYNAIGAIIWASLVTLIGYFAGSWLEARGINVEVLILPIFIIIIVLSFAAPIIHALRDPKMRAKLMRRLGKY